MTALIVFWLLSGQLLWNLYMGRPDDVGSKDIADDIAYLWMCYILGPVQWAMIAHLVAADFRKEREESETES